MAAIAPPGGYAPLAVVGGGISGLAAAHRFAGSFRSDDTLPAVLVLEANGRAGGQIRTERHGDFLFEAGPDALVAQKRAGVALCERIGVIPRSASR